MTSATFASREKSSRLSMNFFASFSPPLMSNVKMDPAPLGKYFLYSALVGWSPATRWRYSV